MSRSGHSLLEMLIVLAIIGLAAAVAGPRLAHRSKIGDIEISARRISTLLAKARVRAIATATPVEVLFEPKHQRVRIENEGAITLPAEILLTVVTGRETVVGDSTAILTFLPNGSASGMEVHLDAGHGRKLRMDVNWLTGLTAVKTE